MSVLIVKGERRLVGRVLRDDLNAVISYNLRSDFHAPGHTGDPETDLALDLALGVVAEYSGKVYEEDNITFAFKWNGAIHVSKDYNDYLQEAKDKKLEELKAEGIRRGMLVYEAVDHPSIGKLIEDIILAIKPTARDPLQADLVELKTIKTNFLTKRGEINALTTIPAVESYDITTGW